MALLGAVGCSPGDSSEGATEGTSGAKPSGEVLAGVDPCGVLSDAELKSFGLKTEGEATNTPPWAPACQYQGDPVVASIHKETRDTVNSAEQKDVWAEFDRTEVNGRTAATAVTGGATQARLCSALFDAGQGMIQIQAHEVSSSDSLDECAKALEIAEKVEPNVPEPA
nr:DUF3558 domain-containing protein [Actinopolyspora halophila]